MKTSYTAIVSTERIKFWRQFSLISPGREGILGRSEAGCLPAYIELAPGLSSASFNIDEDSFVSRGGGGRGEGGGRQLGPDFRLACSPVEPQSGPITWEKFFIEKTPKLLKMKGFY